MQKESLLFFSFPSDSNFSKGKVTKKTREMQKKARFSFFKVLQFLSQGLG